MKVKIKGDIKKISKVDKTDKFLINAIEDYLKEKPAGKDRNHGWNSPSGVGLCSRHSFFLRTGVPADSISNEPRLQRIFDNGTGVHIRLQSYLKRAGVLLDDEAPLFNLEHKIMGTTDGLLKDGNTLAVLEIKSINNYGFSTLKDAKPEHKLQAGIYLYCLNELRKEILRGKRREIEKQYILKLTEFLQTDKKFTKEEKITRHFNSFKTTLDWLEKYPSPLTKVIFLYENKDTQELKEFVVYNPANEIAKALKKFDDLNIAVETGNIPVKSKSFNCNTCRYKKECEQFE